MATKAPQPAAYERSDVCAVPAASVIVENVVAFEIAAAVVEKYVGTSLEAIQTAMDALHELNRRGWPTGATRPPELIRAQTQTDCALFPLRVQGVPASHRTGFKAASKMRLFLGLQRDFAAASGRVWRAGWAECARRSERSRLAFIEAKIKPKVFYKT